ncbi:MAG: CDP-glycerol glycerophosphotransferase family protein [Patescibacteria group bacterium]
MKTIFFIFSRGIVARNILRTDVFRILKERPDVRMALFVPRNIPDYFREECAHPRVVLEESDDLSYGIFRRKIFEPLLQNTVYTATSKFMNRYSGRARRKSHRFLTYCFLHVLYTIWSHLPFLKPIFRFLEYHLFPDRVFDPYFEKYKPDLVVATTVMSKRDIAMMKAARRHEVPTVGLTRGWDNLDRLFMPFVPGKLVVQNTLMKERAVRLHAIPAERIFVAGLPQFDIYRDQSIYKPRDEFLRGLGLDPARKVILYGSEGQWAPNDEAIVRIIYRMIANDELMAPCSLIIRPHFSDVYEHRFDEFRDKPNVFLEHDFRLSKFFTDMWDPSREEMVRLANEFKHMDLLITYISTIVLEGAIFDKPVINIDFYADDEPDRGPYFGRWYGASHYQDILKTGGVRLAKSAEDLKRLINMYLLKPETDRGKRKQLVETMCGAIDGRAGERIANFILQELKT